MPEGRWERVGGDSVAANAHGMRPIYPPLHGADDRVPLREFIVVGAIGLLIGAALRLIIAVAIS